MQAAMLRLDALLRRRKRTVLALWAVILLVAVPFSMRQSEDLSSGGFGVPGSQSAAVAADLREDLDVAAGPQDGVWTHLVGQGALWAAMQDLSKEDLAKAESAGFPVVLLILLAVFGSLAAAALPLGLGVAVDYSLFVVARYREEVRAGRPAEEARAVAMATSGLAVLFSGLTVIISLAGLWMLDNTAIRSMALGAMLVVAVAMLAAVTLLPALMALLGRRVHGRSRLLRFTGLLRRRRGGAGAPGPG